MKKYILLILLPICMIFAQGVMFQTILIDPGHGGSDRGALGRNGSDYPDECDINLNVANSLKSTLQNQLATVIMTRTNDSYPSLEQRAEDINDSDPDAAISIHFNSNGYSSLVQGTSTLWCKPWVSRCLAGSVHDELLKMGYVNMGVRYRGGLKLLNLVDATKQIPTILVEPLYISEIDGWNKMTFSGGVIGNLEVATHISNGLIHYFDNTFNPPPKNINIGHEFMSFGLRIFFAFHGGKQSTRNLKSPYYVYSSDDPYKPIDEWDLAYEGSNEYYDTTLSFDRKFFKVKYIDGSDIIYSDVLKVLKKNCKTGYNWITIPDLNGNLCSGDDITTASDILDKYPEIESVSYWNSNLQRWKTATKLRDLISPKNKSYTIINNFVISEGQPLEINATSDFEFIAVGTLENESFYSLNPGYNFIMLPFNKADLLMSIGLGNNISSCTRICEFDSELQLSRISIKNEGNPFWSFMFPIYVGNPYMIYTTESQIWPSENIKSRNYKKDGNTNKRLITKGDKIELTNPRNVIFRISTDQNISEINANNYQIKAYLKNLPSRILSLTSNDIQIMSCNNNILGVLNLGNFFTNIKENDKLVINAKNLQNNQESEITVKVDDLSDAIILGFDKNYHNQLKLVNSLSTNETPKDELKINSYPNPFNNSTNISFKLDIMQKLKITIYNSNGELIKTLVNDRFNKGVHNFSWDGTNKNYSSVPSGVYFLKLKTEKEFYVKKLIFNK